jgi:hypothetical protein
VNAIRYVQAEYREARHALTVALPGLYTLYRSWGMGRLKASRLAASCAWSVYRIRPEGY